MSFKLLAQRAPWGSDVEFQLGRFDGPLRSDFSVATSLQMEPLERDQALPRSPLFRLDQTEAQALMDQLWQCGLRPSEGSGSAGSLAATERHLEDMRRLVFEPPVRTFQP
jgi:hypothetical protein